MADIHQICLGLALALGGAASALPAQQADTTGGRDSSRVDRRARRAQPLPPVMVTGSLAPAPPERIGVAREVITREALRAEPSRAAVDPLRRSVGVFIDEATGPLGPTIIRLRGGEETFTQVLVDGVQINENGGFFDAQGLTLVNVDRLEIARGPQSALYGSSAMSGVVQIFTRAGEVGPPRTELAAEGGRTSAFGGAGRGFLESAGGTTTTRWSVGAGTAYDRGPYRLPHDLRANDASLRLDFLPRAPFQLTAVARYMGVDSKLPVRDPGVTRAPLDPNQRQGRDRLLGTVQGRWAPSDWWTHTLTLSHYRRVFTYDDRKDGLDPQQFPFFVFDANYHYRSVVRRTTARYVGTVTRQPRPALDVVVSYGGQWERETLDDRASGDFGPSSSALRRPNVAAFAEAQLRLGERLSLLAGSRVEKFRGLDAAYVPRATAVFEVVPRRLALRAAAGRAYKAPNIQDQFPNNPVIVSNPNLRPETSASGELGADVTLSRATASVTVFRQRYDNLIRSVPYDTGGRQINRNLGRSRASGVEVAAALRPRTRWTLGAEGAWTATRVLDNKGLPSDQFPTGDPLPFRPAYTASAFVELPATRALSVLARLSAVGRQTVLTERFSGTRASIDPYTVVMVTGTYGVSPSLDAYLHIENALGAGYQTAYDRPGMPRSVALGVRVRP